MVMACHGMQKSNPDQIQELEMGRLTVIREKPQNRTCCFLVMDI